MNTRKFVNCLDYSLDQIKLREIYEKVYRRKDFSFRRGHKDYCSRVVNVTFKYTVDEFNKIATNKYIKIGFIPAQCQFEDSICVIDGELVGIILNEEVKNPVSKAILGKYFTCEDGKYVMKSKPKRVKSTAELRKMVYEDGFMCGGIKFIRWKRSCGSSRVGKCLFIDERLYPRMHKWEVCGIKVNPGDSVDLAGFESYISLPTSSIIDTINIDPNSILVIDDYESVFKDKVISVEEESSHLVAYEKECEIANSIWDGQGLLDESVFEEKYSDKGMILLRNRFFKCCCFNTKIQKWFADNGITDVSQLNGYTKAESIEDIKLITTPSSIKYLKFGTLNQWLNHIEPEFGVVKYDKKTHFLGGRMVQTHYQLLNTLQMTKDEVAEFLKPTIDYLNLLKNDPDILRYHIKYPIEEDFNITPAKSKNDVIYKMLGVNDKFAQTKLYYDFRSEVMKSYVANLRHGKVLVDGNYSTLCGNPIEMLLHTIGKFDGTSQIGVGNVHSIRFPTGQTLLASRSPHVSMSNVWLPYNSDNEIIDRYLNLSEQIVCVNSINENTLFRLAGCDFDSDSVLLTDNQCLISAAQKNYDKFPVAIMNVSSSKIARKHTSAEQCDLDIKTSNNLIGDIINLSQELNTQIWHKINHGATYEDIKDIYKDVCILSIASNIEINI